jgi:hypothetical protein
MTRGPLGATSHVWRLAAPLPPECFVRAKVCDVYEGFAGGIAISDKAEHSFEVDEQVIDRHTRMRCWAQRVADFLPQQSL